MFCNLWLSGDTAQQQLHRLQWILFGNTFKRYRNIRPPGSAMNRQ